MSLDSDCGKPITLTETTLFVHCSNYQFCLICPSFSPQFLARHGETIYNAEGRIQGTLDSCLNLNGVDQAGELGNFLSGLGLEFDSVFASNMTRARQTLSVVKAVNHGSPARLPNELVDGMFREIELREWEGMLKVDIEREHPELWKTWRSTPEKVIMNDGSTPLVDLWERARNCWSTVVCGKGDSKTSLIVCHGALGKAMLARAMGEEIRGFRDSHYALTNAECVEVEFVDGEGTRWR